MQKMRQGNYFQTVFCFLKKLYITGKSKWSVAWFDHILITFKLARNRNKLFKILHYWSRDMLNFDFLDKGLGIVSPAHFVYDFLIKMFLMLHSIDWPNFVAWLPLFPEILSNMCIAIVCYPGCDVMDSEIKLFFLIQPFFLPKSNDKNLNILRTKRAF